MNARITAWMGLSGVATVVTTTVVGGLMVPGYRHTSQFISELGARQSPIELPVRFAGFLLAGLLLSVFACAAYCHLPRSVGTAVSFVGLFLYASGYTVAAFFPCDPGCRPAEPTVSQVIHNFAGLLGYVASPLFLVAFGRSAKHWPAGTHLAPFAYAASVFAFAGLLTLSPDSQYVGLSQRLIELSVLGWVTACACYIIRRHSKQLRSIPAGV